MFMKANQQNIGRPTMDSHEPPHSSSVTAIKISTHSQRRPISVSAVEGVQLPSPFLLGSNALATAAAPASPIWLAAWRGGKINVVEEVTWVTWVILRHVEEVLWVNEGGG
jgi:hypothetical protein